jgi:hypothetical protein
MGRFAGTEIDLFCPLFSLVFAHLFGGQSLSGQDA